MKVGMTLLEAFRIQGNGRRTRTGATGLRAFASEAGYCRREVAYNIAVGQGYASGRQPWDTTLNKEISFAIGRALEQPIYGAIIAQDPTARHQVPWIAEGGKVTGVADIVYEIGGTEAEPDYSNATVVEVKTMTQSYFKTAMSKGPQEKHILQCAVSAVALGAPWCHLIYLSKNSSRDDHPLLEWRFQTPYDMGRAALQELVNAVESVQRGEIPEPVFQGEVIQFPNVQGEPCMWCNHVARCVNDGPGIRLASE